MLDIAWQSLRNRWSTALLAVLAIAISVALILTVDQVRRDARTAFVQTVSGTDLVIGARSGAVQLLLYSVFRMGNATNNMSWESATEIAERQEVAWTIPLSLGDSYRGYRVLGTNQGYFTHYRFGRDRQLSLNEGVVFDDVFDAVLGSEVARALDHEIGDEIIIAHGTGSVGLTTHDNQPFSVAGILAPTGTPVDRTVHVSLEGIEAVHVQLWDLVGVAEKALLAVSAVVVFAGLINLISVLLSSLAERRREMAILRSAGASPGTVFRLLCLESSLLAIAGIVAHECHSTVSLGSGQPA